MLKRQEMNMPPQEFQDRLTYLGGTNRFDLPNFIVWWNQYAHGEGSFRAGGVWSVDERYFKGYRDLLKGSGEPCWCLGQWHSPEVYGSPEQFYIENVDPDTGLQILGEYGYSGKYECIYNLRWHEREDDKLILHTMPLSDQTFDLIIPIILKAKEVSAEKRKQAILDAREREEAEKLGEIERYLHERSMPFKGAVSYTAQGIRSTEIDRKMLEMQKTWNQAAANAKKFRLGQQTQ